MSKGARIWVVLIGMLLVGAFGVELFARHGLGLGDPPLTIRDPAIEYMFKPGTYQRFGNTIHYNSFSMRAEETTPEKTRPDELRVLVMGDSVVNGGVLTDDSELATRLAQARLTERLGRPVWIGNVSAGSWGPGNLLAYAERFGWFDADVVVFLLSSHDLGDIPSFPPDLGPDFPLEKPLLASWEAAARYLPRYIPLLRSRNAAANLESLSSAELEARLVEGRGLLRELLETAYDSVPAIAILHHSEQVERKGRGTGERADTLRRAAAVIAADAKASTTPYHPLEPYLDRGPEGESPYRDSIHINALGQRLYADAIICVVELALGLDGETCV